MPSVLDAADDLPVSDALLSDTVAPWTPRSDGVRAAHQVAAIDAFNRAREQAVAAGAAAARSREMRMDAERRLEVLRRQHDALVEQAQRSLQRSGQLLFTVGLRTALLAHRNAWFLERVSQALVERGLVVVATTDNGAEAVGCAVAEQPDLVLVEDVLAMVPGEQVVRDVRQFCEGSRVVAQVGYGDRVGALLDAGAAAVYTRRVPPVDVAAGMDRVLASG